MINAGGDVTLAGSQVKGKRVELDAENLNIESLQDKSSYHGKQMNVSGSVSANFETPFGENGAAQSTKQATDKDGNLLYTDKNGNTTVNSKGVDGQENTKKLAEGKESLQFSYGMGYGKDSDSQSSTTKSGINTQNIIIKDEAEQLKRTGKTVQEEIAAIKTDITTESAQSQSGKLENRFNKDDVQKELDFQREVTEKFGPNVAEAGSLLANKFGEEAKAKRHEAAIALEEAEKAKAENNNETNRTLVKQARDNFETASREAKEWETGGSQRLVIDSALNVISTALAGRPAAEVVASGLSPAVNNQIKKATTDAKGNVNTALNLTAHAVWGVVEAYSANQNAAAGAGGALAGEVMADVIAKELYGKKPNQLNREEKEVVSSVSQAAGALVGGAAANSSQGVGVGLTTAKNAVENNYLSVADVENLIRELSKAQKEGRDTKPILEKYKGISEENRQQLIACKGNVACETAHLHEMNTGAEELERNLGFFSRMTVYYPNDLNTANRIALSNLVESENAESFNKLSDTTKFGLNAMEAGTAIGLGAATGYAKVGFSNVKSLISGKNKAYPTSGMDGYKRANVGDEDYPEGIHFSMNLKNHLIQGEGINQRRGVVGGHNRENFLNTLSQGDGRIVKEESTNVDGITRIHYEIPRLGRDGKPDGTYKAISSPKTVYDPIKFSDHEMLEMGQKAVAKGYSDLLERNRLDPKAYQDSQKINGIQFHYYINTETKGVTNVHPK